MPLTVEEQLRADLDALVKRVKSLEVALNVVVLSGVAGAFGLLLIALWGISRLASR